MPDVWVTRWVDYTSRYGVVYQLPDGSVGVYFNDSTKALCAPDGSCFDYIPRSTAEKQGARSKHTFDDFPADLQKKVTLLKHFRQSIGTDALTKHGATAGQSSLPTDKWIPRPGTFEVYVRKWCRRSSAIMFSMSNKDIQVVFFDTTEVVVSFKGQMVTYRDKHGSLQSMPLSVAVDSPSGDLARRMRYILSNLLQVKNEDLPAGLQSEAH
jgi:polo-like kinase 1